MNGIAVAFSDKWKIEARSFFVLHITAIYSNSVVKLRNKSTSNNRYANRNTHTKNMAACH